MRRISVFLSLMVLITNLSTAQSNTLSSIEKIDFKNIQVIKNGEELIGYYAFYKTTTKVSNTVSS
jgi:hypothetical protein